MQIRARQTLLVDADDTLWENNIYFEQAIASFISFLNHREFTPEQVREVLNQVECECIIKHGYGLKSFVRSLVATFEQLSVEPITPALHETIHGIARTIAEQPIELMPKVAETLDYLSARHDLFLVTKGDDLEQAGKVERSGLKHHFRAVEIVAEKNAEAYRELAERHRFPVGETWMVGNSPKSDINPALSAGLNAVFVPHDQTWILEHEELCQPSGSCRLLVVENFGQLRTHF
jgi:putative hydrolase of the HAD superfamily